jgi:hypothetical protein
MVTTWHSSRMVRRARPATPTKGRRAGDAAQAELEPLRHPSGRGPRAPLVVATQLATGRQSAASPGPIRRTTARSEGSASGLWRDVHSASHRVLTHTVLVVEVALQRIAARVAMARVPEPLDWHAVRLGNAAWDVDVGADVGLVVAPVGPPSDRSGRVEIAVVPRVRGCGSVRRPFRLRGNVKFMEDP